MITAVKIRTGTQKFKAAYSGYMAPLSRELGMAQTALDILLFLANNPACPTAGDICRYLGLKPAIVSFHVEKLVQQGLLERLPARGDRRRCPLAPTDTARPLIDRGRRMQEDFSRALNRGLTEEELEVFARCLDIMGENMAALAEDVGQE